MKRATLTGLGLGLGTLLAVTMAHAASPAHALVRQAIAAMGPGRDLHRIAAIRSNGVSVSHDIAEFDHSDAPYLLAGAARVTTIDDLRRDRRHVEEDGVTGSGAPGRHVRQLYTAKVEELDIGAAGAGIRIVHEATPSWQTDEPIRTLLLAEQAGDLRQEPDTRVHGIAQHVLSFHHGRYRVRLFLDALSGLPSAIETLRALHRADGDIAWNAWGDLQDRVELMNYDLIEGVRYPLQSDLLRNGVPLRTVVRSDVHFDAVPVHDEALDAAPERLAGPARYADDIPLGQPLATAPDPHKPIAEIAPGIVQIPGSWYSTIVRQDDGLVILDAPISAGYSSRVLAEAARRFPGVPVKAVVTSTAFYWHIAGIREYAARGIAIYTRDRNVPVLRALLAAPHTLVPDALARTPRAADIHPVSAPTRIGTGRNAIVVMPVREGEQPMVMSWIADAHLLHTAEMVQPLGPHGALVLPEALLELEHSVQAAGIPTHGLRMIGMHMSPTPWQVLEQALQAAAG